MAAQLEFYIKKETLETILKTLDVKNSKGFSMTLSINDQSNQYGQNVTGHATQTKEDKEADKPKFYIGNGRVFWEDGKVFKAVKKECNEIPELQTPSQESFDAKNESDQLPF